MPTVVKGNPKAPFSIAYTLRCRGGCHSFPCIASLTFDPHHIMLIDVRGHQNSNSSHLQFWTLLMIHIIKIFSPFIHLEHSQRFIRIFIKVFILFFINMFTITSPPTLLSTLFIFSFPSLRIKSDHFNEVKSKYKWTPSLC